MFRIRLLRHFHYLTTLTTRQNRLQGRCWRWRKEVLLMMAAAFRVGLVRVSNLTSKKFFAQKQNPNIKIVRNISGKALRCLSGPIRKPAPWPYNDKNFTNFHAVYDKTTARMDENSKVVVVEGPVAAGKSKFAEQLAEELDMLYLPEANLDMEYINDRGYDLRQLDEQLPESCRSFDVNNFLVNPKHRLTATFQLKQYIIKYSQYIDALAHVLSTGQGVVLDRCVYSDFVFLEAMYNQGYVSKGARSAYYDLRRNTINELLRPHLVIYLDVPINRILQNIKKRAIPYEKNSKVLTKEYLAAMEKKYKHDYLKEISKHAELLVYDWSEEGEVEIVVEDIERIDFTRTGSYSDPRLRDWDFSLEEEWGIERHKYADQKVSLMAYVNIPRFDVPELVISADDFDQYEKVLETAPGEKFEQGFDPTMGDTGYFFKTGKKNRGTLPLRERRIPMQ